LWRLFLDEWHFLNAASVYHRFRRERSLFIATTKLDIILKFKWRSDRNLKGADRASDKIGGGKVIPP